MYTWSGAILLLASTLMVAAKVTNREDVKKKLGDFDEVFATEERKIVKSNKEIESALESIDTSFMSAGDAIYDEADQMERKLETEKAALIKQVKALEEGNEKQAKKIAALQEENGKQAKKIAVLQEENGKQAKKIAEQDTTIKNQAAKIKDLQDDIIEKDKKIIKQQTQIKKLQDDIIKKDDICIKILYFESHSAIWGDLWGIFFLVSHVPSLDCILYQTYNLNIFFSCLLFLNS